MSYRKRGQARHDHEHGVFARFRYDDLKEAGRGCGGRGPLCKFNGGKERCESPRGLCYSAPYMTWCAKRLAMKKKHLEERG